MDSPTPPASVRQSLLHRPQPPDDAIARPGRLATLDTGLDLPLTLVCAPAGFGKSIIVSQWAETIGRPVAWLAMDATVDDPRWFLAHLTEAVRRIAPDALKVASQMASAPRLPELRAVVTELSNGLDELPEPIVVVLDDYHQVTSPLVHEMVAELIRHPAELLHLVIISRTEPSLPIGVLRVRGRVKELRMADLSFIAGEVELFAKRHLERDLSPEQSRELFITTEGWPAGVRLAIESLRLSGDNEVVGVGMLDQVTQDQVLAEILDRAPLPVRRYLLAASLFDRFSAELCDAALADAVPGPAPMTGSEFIDWMRRHNLFIVELDDDGVWYRFHHLFAHLLDNWRTVYGSDPQVKERDIRLAAAAVFRAHDMVEEAIAQLHLAGDDADLAVLAAEYGNQLIEEERWPELSRLLSTIPGDLRDNEPALLVLSAWLLGDVQARHREMIAALDRAEGLLDQRPGTLDGTSRSLRGQIAALRSAFEKFTTADFDGAVADAEVARELLATSPGRHLTFAYVSGVVSLAGAGRSEEAHRLASSVMGDERFAGAPFDPMAWALPYLGWLEGDLASEERHATQLLAIGERFGMPDTIASAHYFLGTAAYERNLLEDATHHLNRVLDLRFATLSVNPVHSWMARSLAALAQGRADEAGDLAASMMQFVLDTHSDYLQPTAEAFLAELDLRRGRSAAALRWANTADPEAHRHRFLFYDPSSTLVEVLLASEPDADRGRQMLVQYLDAAQHRRHRPLTLRLLGLQALDLAARDDESGALDSLERAVRISQDSGMIRRLADLGPALIPLLHRLDVTGDALAHVGSILAAIESATDTGPSVPTAQGVPTVAGEPALTPREFDVLRLLAAHKTNKEIAQELFIAPGTVKKNTVRLYDKLNVHGRRDAVAKARALGYLGD